MSILVTGADGYMGWPISLRLADWFHDERIILTDNFARRKWVEDCGAVSAIPIQSMKKRMQAANKIYPNMNFVEGDLVDKAFVDKLVALYKPHTVVHLAAQPSAPYSQINFERADYTQKNNLDSTRNVIWSLKDNKMKETHLIETTTTGVYGAPAFNLPEGFMEVEYKGKKDRIPSPGLGGSWYHITKCMDFENLYLHYRQTKQPITDIKTSIITGAETPETAQDPALATRFDFDFWFGVVTNRFCAQVVAGYPLTIYGKGEQRKPMGTLEDAVQSTCLTVKKGNEGKFQVYNQTSGAFAIKDIAAMVGKAAEKVTGESVEIRHYPNPRIENEQHQMVIENDEFKKVLGREPEELGPALERTIELLVPNKARLLAYKDRFLPEVLR